MYVVARMDRDLCSILVGAGTVGSCHLIITALVVPGGLRYSHRSLHGVSKAAVQSQGGESYQSSFALRCFVFTPQAIIKLCVDQAVTC